MKLRELLGSIPGAVKVSENCDQDIEIKGLSTNSHACQQGDLFIGMPGTRVDGGEFWSSAITTGAVAALISPQAGEKKPPSLEDCVVIVDDIVAACAAVAACFYEHPSQKLKMV